MPPRYAFWTILIDNKPTAFRAREREELLPTFNQLRRKNTDVVMKWFARGHPWGTPPAGGPPANTRAPGDAKPWNRPPSGAPPRDAKPWTGPPSNTRPPRD